MTGSMSDGLKLFLALAGLLLLVSLPFIGLAFQASDTPADRAGDRARRGR